MQSAPSSYLQAAALCVGCLLWPLASNAQEVAAAGLEPLCQPGDRFDRGLQRLNEITKGQGQAVVDSLSRTSPDLARYIIEYPYGDVFCRDGLSDQQRQIATIAALAAIGYTNPELKVHIHGALNVGLTEEEVIETMILMSVYAGFPATIHGLRAAQEVFDERASADLE